MRPRIFSPTSWDTSTSMRMFAPSTKPNLRDPCSPWPSARTMVHPLTPNVPRSFEMRSFSSYPATMVTSVTFATLVGVDIKNSSSLDDTPAELAGRKSTTEKSAGRLQRGSPFSAPPPPGETDDRRSRADPEEGAAHGHSGPLERAESTARLAPRVHV